jgi:hypothetical protein
MITETRKGQTIGGRQQTMRKGDAVNGALTAPMMTEGQGGDNRQQTADNGQEAEAKTARVEMEALRETVAAQRREIERLEERQVHECCLLSTV